MKAFIGRLAASAIIVYGMGRALRLNLSLHWLMFRVAMQAVWSTTK